MSPSEVYKNVLLNKGRRDIKVSPVPHRKFLTPQEAFGITTSLLTLTMLETACNKSNVPNQVVEVNVDSLSPGIKSAIETRSESTISSSYLWVAKPIEAEGYKLDTLFPNADKISLQLYDTENGSTFVSFNTTSNYKNALDEQNIQYIVNNDGSLTIFGQVQSEVQVYDNGSVVDKFTIDDGSGEQPTFMQINYGRLSSSTDIKSLSSQDLQRLALEQIGLGQVTNFLIGNPYQIGENSIAWIIDPAKLASTPLVSDIALISAGLQPIVTHSDGPPPSTPIIPVFTETPVLPTSATPTKTPIPTHTEILSPTSEPAWMTTIKTQDPESRSFQVVDGKPVIDLYDTSTTETIILKQETIKITPTTDGLNPNILTAQDIDGNIYALNPDYGWFRVPAEVQMDYNNYREYTELPFRFFEDGTANIIAALKYSENPTISPDSITPHYWANYSWFKNILYVGLFPTSDIVDAHLLWPELSGSSYFKPEQKPFAWNSFFTTTVPSGEKIYIINRTSKNPTVENPDQTINLFYGMNKTDYERAVTEVMGGGRTDIQAFIEGADRSAGDFVINLFPPQTLPDGTPFYCELSTYDLIVNNLQERGEIMALFSEEDQNMIWQAVLSGLRYREGEYTKGIDSWSTPLTSLPEKLAKYIIPFDYK